MKKLPVLSVIFLALLLIPAFQSLSAVRAETEDVNYFIKSTVTYANPSGNTNVWNFTDDDRTISLFMNNTWQTVELVNSTFSIEKTKNDDDGNPVAVLQFSKSVLHAGENVSFTFWYHIVSKPRIIPSISETESRRLSDIPTNLVDKYTGEEGSWQTSNSTLQELALSLKGSETKVLTIIKNFIVWMKDPQHMKYPEERHEHPYYPNETYARGEGDCDDQAILLISLCRIVKIPSYLQTGCIYLPEQGLVNETMWSDLVTLVQRRIGWHGWAVVYVPPWGWLPVDLTFVPEGLSDPLNAIKHGAVTSQDTIQYMNVTHTDYVASSLEMRTFLIDNGFQIYAEDEMILDAGQRLPTLAVEPWLPLVFMALMVFLVATSFLIYRRWIRENLKRSNSVA